MKNINICIAGLGTVGSNVIDSLNNNHQLIIKKINTEFKILAITAKNKSKKRIIDTSKFKWQDNPFDLVKNNKCDILK